MTHLSKKNAANVEILLATYGGEKYIAELLESLLNQTYPNLRILIRDDGSKDSTLSILQNFAHSHPNKISLISDGKNLGVIGNFSELLKYSSADYVLFADQDDFWLPNKVELSVKRLQEMEQKYGVDSPLLVHTDLHVVDQNLQTIHRSFWSFTKINPNFSKLNRLLVQNCVTGCTMTLNRALIHLSYPIPQNVLMHDWWIALIATSFGHIDYLSSPTLLYRQHQSNTLGAIQPNLWHTLKKVLSGQNVTCPTRKQALIFLKIFENQLDSTNKTIVQAFCHLQNVSFLKQRQLILQYRFFKHLNSRNFINFFLPIRY